MKVQDLESLNVVIKERLKAIVVNAFDAVGLQIRKSIKSFPVELSKEERKFFYYVRDNRLSMASDERLFSTMLACKHVVELGIDGDFVECGVWRGGNSILAAAIFKLYGSKKKVYLFDTFEGMTKPAEFDKELSTGKAAIVEFNRSQILHYIDYSGRLGIKS
ncbi:MAG: hypothetical protein HQK96_15820 [Nitrospirae bacterium]|nr:hypothetical protein [Nitrospirota bacterium]